MKINVAKSAGFCFGVKRAIDIALKTAASQNDVYMLSDIVHNEDVVKRIRKAGIKKIKKLTPGGKKTLLIQAHGIPLSCIRKVLALGFQVIDATCPMVKEIHRIAQDRERKDDKIIIIGDKKHDEVRGIAGHLMGEAIIIEDPKNIPLNIIKKIKKAAVVVQSTQNLEKVMKILNVLKLYIKNLKFFNTICRPTQIRQEEIRKMPRENEVMIIIGSKNSANTKRLYEIAKSLNKKTYWVGSKKDIQPEWFKDALKVGVTAGASTPDSTTQEIIRYLKQIS